MPRLPVDGKKVIEHRITLGTKERELLDSAVNAFQLNQIATPSVALMSDVSGMIVFASALAIFFPDIVIPTGEATMDEVTNAINTGIKEGQQRAKDEREQTGSATLDDSEGIRDTIGRLLFNLQNPNWSFGDDDAPGFREAWKNAFG